VKETSRWYSERLGQETLLVRWGHYGVPVLFFPTAGGDAEECERFHIIDAVRPLIEAGRIKVYSCDSVAGREMLKGERPAAEICRLQNQFHAYIREEVVPAVRMDCRDPGIEIIAAGSSIGAFHAVAVLCRYPDVFRQAICMSGSYNLHRFIHGEFTQDLYFASPLHFLPGLDGPILEALRRRFVLLAFGKGRWEDPSETWKLAHILGTKGIPNRVDPWGEEWDHNWPTWRNMLPKYLEELTRSA
jgi:esterase/lipase superfamily enzyme